MNFQAFCEEAKKIDQQTISTNNTFVINFSNSKGKSFSIDPSDIIKFLTFLNENYDYCHEEWKKVENKKDFFTKYEEKSYRAIYKATAVQEDLKTINSLGGSQTKELTKVVSKLICYLADLPYSRIEENTYFDTKSIEKVLRNSPEDFTLLENSAPIENIHTQVKAQFKIWMSNKGLSDRTIYSYAETGIKFSDEILNIQMNFAKSVYDIRAPDEIGKIIIKLKENDDWMQKNATGNDMFQAALNKYKGFLEDIISYSTIPKPFILLSGISGTGKTRFVKQQAQYFREDGANYCLVPVRPDWHEPSDLLGYISRLGNNGAEYIVTDFLRFIVSAWKEITKSIEGSDITYKDNSVPYWLCLDEMNLAPVEQYFADYLSIIETRHWKNGRYHCKPLFNASVFTQVADRSILRNSLNLDGNENNQLWDYFLKHGISIPPNLIVAGTVNMDETTHGFSRKVIDRAFTLDFGEFFPNDYQHYFEPETKAKALSFPTISEVDLELISKIAIDSDGRKSIQFLETVNAELKGTPFELAYRALNELLIAVVCFEPENGVALQAVWDDFLMTKVLPRIEGDSEKLQDDGENSLLNKLESVLAEQLGEIWGSETRPDLLRESIDGEELAIPCRSKKKISWMQHRLRDNGFTSFWP